MEFKYVTNRYLGRILGVICAASILPPLNVTRLNCYSIIHNNHFLLSILLLLKLITK